MSELRLGRRLLLTMVLIPLAGCSISVKQPANGAQIGMPPPFTGTIPVHVVVAGNASYSNLKVTIDGNNVTTVSKSASEDDADVPLGPGDHMLAASADVYCWYCSGQTTHSTATSNFNLYVPRHK